MRWLAILNLLAVVLALVLFLFYFSDGSAPSNIVCGGMGWALGKAAVDVIEGGLK